MPVYKYRSIQEMDAHTWREPGDPELFRAIRFVWELGRRTSTRRPAAGVYKYRDFETMSAARETAVTTAIPDRSA